MTNREFLTAISNADLPADLVEYAEEQLKKMDERNAKRSSKPSKHSIENAPIKEQILAHLAEVGEAQTAPDIGEAIGQTFNKVGALCRQLMDDGKVTREERKVPKKGKMVFWGLANN